MAPILERSLFAEAGGFPPIPLMEDLALSRALARKREVAVRAAIGAERASLLQMFVNRARQLARGDRA